MPVRKNVVSLSTPERAAFIAALKAMKKSGVYDTYVLQHSLTMRTPSPPNTDPSVCNMAHRGPSFAPWHREYLRRFEKDLGVTLPYWDWAADQDGGSPKTAPVWGIDLMGPNGDAGTQHVSSGPFAHNPADPNSWSTVRDTADPGPDMSTPWLTREFGNSMQPNLPTKTNERDAMNVVPYDSAPWNVTSSGFRNFLEGFIGPGMHNAAHMWVGGSMMPSTSPNDPVFFLHHANVDRIWANWQRKYYKIQGYLPVSGGPTGHNLNDGMFPWGGTTTPQSVLDTFALGYWYDDAPPPVVTSISPTTGAAAGGTTVVITGSGFMGTTAVKFGSLSATGFTVDKDTQITARTPAGASKVDIRVTTPIATSAASAADQFTYAAPPPTPHPPTPTPHPPTPTPHPPTPTPHPPTPHPPTSGGTGTTGHAGFSVPEYPLYPPPPPFHEATPPSTPPILVAPSGGNNVAIVGVVGLAALMGMVAATGVVAVVAISKDKS
jgi:Common central domain of tyrosinase/IPT/TIG domain